MTDHDCPVCDKPLQANDVCATDIELGICHAACLDGSPTVDLETGEPADGEIDTYRYGDFCDDAPAPQDHVLGVVTGQMEIEPDVTASDLGVNAEPAPMTCERCQGNGEIVTDWERYKHPHEGDIGDEAVAECPDCGGEGIIDVSPSSEQNVRATDIDQRALDVADDIVRQMMDKGALLAVRDNDDELVPMALDRQFQLKAGWQIAIAAALTVPPTLNLNVLDELSKRTFAVQHNPNCPSPWLVRLPGKGPIDMLPYGDPLRLVKHQTGDILGFGKTLEEAGRAALAASEGSTDAT